MQRPGSVTAIAIVEIVLSIIGLVMMVLAIMAVGAITDMAEGVGSALAEAAEASGDTEMMDALGSASATAAWMLYVGVAISIISLIGGIMMLKGASWTPFVAIGTWALKIVIGLLGGAISIWLLVPILFTAIYANLLYQPDAKAYFSGSAS